MTQVLYEEKEEACIIEVDEAILREAEKLSAKKVARRKRQDMKKMSRAMRKLNEKAKYNVNYMKELKNVKNLKAQMNFRNRNVY